MITADLQEKTVSDIMQRDVVTATSEMTVRELVQLLADEGVSGVPVLDPDGRIEGVVSASDVVRMAAHEAEIPAGEMRWVPDPRGHGDAGEVAGGADLPGAEDVDDGVGEEHSPYYFTPDTPVWFTTASAPATETALDEMTVADIMTPVAFSIPAGESIAELIRFFLRGRVHRALVVADERLLGIVTPFDVLRGVLDEPQEAES